MADILAVMGVPTLEWVAGGAAEAVWQLSSRALWVSRFQQPFIYDSHDVHGKPAAELGKLKLELTRSLRYFNPSVLAASLSTQPDCALLVSLAFRCLASPGRRPPASVPVQTRMRL
jgi:hypothetical protein